MSELKSPSQRAETKDNIMIEKKIEDKIGEKIEAAFTDKGIDSFQILKAWSCAEQTEDKDASVIVVLKVHPRGYETYTVPTATFPIEVTLIARADIDFDGIGYIEVTEALFDTLHVWQKDIHAACLDFDIEGEFSTAGMRMDGGSTGLDRENKTWTCTENLTLYGCIEQ